MTLETCDKEIPEKYVTKALDQTNNAGVISTERRLLIRKLAIGTAALASSSALPETWTSPILKFAALPAHATTSGDIAAAEASLAEAIEAEAIEAEAIEAEAPEAEAPEAEAPEASGDLRGYSNSLTIDNTGDKMSCDKVLQDKFVFAKLGPQYGKSLLIVWSDGRELSVPDSSNMAMNADDYRKYQPGGPYSDNNPDIPTMEVYAARGTHPSSVTIYY